MNVWLAIGVTVLVLVAVFVVLMVVGGGKR